MGLPLLLLLLPPLLLLSLWSLPLLLLHPRLHPRVPPCLSSPVRATELTPTVLPTVPTTAPVATVPLSPPLVVAMVGSGGLLVESPSLSLLPRWEPLDLLFTRRSS